MQPAWLEQLVEDVRVVAPVRGVPHEVERLPDGRTAICLRVLDDGSRDVWVIGPRTRALFKTVKDVARSVVVELRPGWATTLLGVPASSLVDHHVSLEQLWGREGAALTDELVAMRDAGAIVERLARELAAREQRTERAGGAAGRLARRAVQLLEHDGDRVEAVADRLGVTARHLRRVFVECFGIGPKEFGRCVRLGRAVRRAGASAGDWGRVAVDAGYYDQAHLIGDFRDLLGVTPSEYAKRALVRVAC